MVLSGLSLATASIQDVFDYIVLRLIQQGRSATNDGVCMYRAPRTAHEADNTPAAKQSLRCALGQIIPDAEYKTSIEGAGPGRVLLCSPSLKAWETTVSDSDTDLQTFLADMQRAHDGEAVLMEFGCVLRHDERGWLTVDADWLRMFRRGARLVAKRYQLDDSICTYREPAETASVDTNQYTAPVISAPNEPILEAETALA